LCTQDTIAAGLREAQCLPVKMVPCPGWCVDLEIDPHVYAEAGLQVRSALEQPCIALRPADRAAAPPNYFFLNRQFSSSALWCSWPVSIGARRIEPTEKGIRVHYGYIIRR